jgi:hypothetical protein
VALMPASEIGVWDARIFVIPMPGVFFFDVRVTAARESGRSGDSQLTRKEKRVINAIFWPVVVINKVQMTKFKCQIKAKAEMTRAGGCPCRRLVTGDCHGLRPRNDDSVEGEGYEAEEIATLRSQRQRGWRERTNGMSDRRHRAVAPVTGILKDPQPWRSPEVMSSDIGLPFCGLPFFGYPRPLPEQE